MQILKRGFITLDNFKFFIVIIHFLPQVRVLFSKGPFIYHFASDPHIIIKAINQNLNSVLRDSNINGHDLYAI